MKKKLLAALLATAMVLSATACGSKEAAAPAAPAATEEKAEEAAPAEEAAAPAGDMHFEIVSKGFQHQYWQAVLLGAQTKADELGVSINFVGPDSESNISQQVQQLDAALAANPTGIGLAALDTSSVMDQLQSALDAGLPIVGFDSGVPNAPEGSILANCATDNYAAGEMAAEKTYEAVASKITADGQIRIGVLQQDATSESVINRGLGFIDKFAELAAADGFTTVITGNDKYITDSKVEAGDAANVVLEVLVPAQVDSALSATDCTTLLNKADTIAIYGSNQHSAEAMVTADENLGKFGADGVIGVGFDSGAVIKAAVADGTFLGAITQAPVAMGEKLIELLVAAANGETISDVDTGCQWYTADNMTDPSIAPNLYD